MQINQYPNEAFDIQDEDFYDVDYWDGVAWQSRKISGATIKSVLAATNIYNADGSLTTDRFLDLANKDLNFADTSGTTVFKRGTRILLIGNAGQAVGYELNADSGQERYIKWISAGDERWRLTTDNAEIGGDIGSDLVLNSYDDAGVLLAELIRFQRQGIITICGSYRLPNTDGTLGQVLTTDGAGNVSWQPVSGILGNTNRNFATQRYDDSIASPFTIAVGGIKNFCTFFDLASVNTGSTTPYYGLKFKYSRSIKLSGTSGTANINVNGVNYLATFSTDLAQTALNWVGANAGSMAALSIQVFQLGSAADGRIRFTAFDNAILDAITITNVSGDLSGNISNEFTGLALAQLDHFQVPYGGTEIDGQRLLHIIRSNFDISTGSVHYAEFNMYAINSDTRIEAVQQIVRNTHVASQEVTYNVQTFGGSDIKVKAGFYLAINNVSNTNWDVEGRQQLNIYTHFENPTLF